MKRSRWLVIAGVLLLCSWAGSEVYLRASSAASYAVEDEVEYASIKGSAQMVFQDRLLPPMSAGGAMQFGRNGQCNVNYENKVQDQYDTDNTNYSWRHVPGKPATVYFETGKLSATYRTYAEQGVVRWNELAPECIDARTITTCLPNTNCVLMEEETDPNARWNGQIVLGLFSPMVDPLSRTYVLGSKITMYAGVLNNYPSTYAPSTTTHEIGHALGLYHRNSPLVIMHPTNNGNRNALDQIDRANIFVIYGMRYFEEAAVPSQFSSPTGPPVALPPVID